MPSEKYIAVEDYLDVLSALSESIGDLAKQLEEGCPFIGDSYITGSGIRSTSPAHLTVLGIAEYVSRLSGQSESSSFYGKAFKTAQEIRAELDEFDRARDEDILSREADERWKWRDEGERDDVRPEMSE